MDLWRQSISADGRPTGEAEAMSAGLGIRTAAFSPDGTKLAFSRGRMIANVWRVPIFDDRAASWADAEQVTFGQAFTSYPDISPDGESLLVSSDRTGNQEIWKLAAGGGEMTRLTVEPTFDWSPRWSPDGKEIAFFSFRSGDSGRLGRAFGRRSGPTTGALPVGRVLAGVVS